MTKHKEALEALGRIHAQCFIDAMTRDEINADVAKVMEALQAASWQDIENWKNDSSNGEYVLVSWAFDESKDNDGLVEEMHWSAVETYRSPKYQSGSRVTHFMRMPAAPVDGGE